MKFRISTCMAGIALLAAFAIAPVQLTSQSAQTMYKIVPLDTLGGVSGRRERHQQSRLGYRVC